MDRALNQAETRGFANQAIAARATELYYEKIAALKEVVRTKAEYQAAVEKLDAINRELAGLK